MICPPTLDLGLLKPFRFTPPVLRGTSIDAPRSLSGLTQAIDYSGGGFWEWRLGSKLYLPQHHLYYGWLQGYLRGSVRSIRVPLFTDFYVPVTWATTPGSLGAGAGGTPLRGFTSHSDGTTFSDTSQYAQDAVYGVTTGGANLNDASLSFTMIGGQQLSGGEIFSIRHAQRDWRAYRVTWIDSVTGPDGNGNYSYAAAVTPPLRETTPSGAYMRFVRPICLMRLAPGQDLDDEVQTYWQADVSIIFQESLSRS